MVVAEILFLFIITLWIYILWTRRKYYAFVRKMPGPIGLPLIGIGHKINRMSDILYELPKIASQYQVKTYFTWIGPWPTVYTMEPKIAEIILNSPDCINKSLQFYDPITTMIGDGILTSKSSKWTKSRKLLTYFLRNKSLLSFFPKFNKISLQLCDELDQHVGCGEVNIRQLVYDLSLKSALSTVLGLDFQKESESNKKMLTYMQRIFSMTADNMLHPFFRIPIIYSFTNMCKVFKEARTFVMEFVTEKFANKIKILEQQSLNEDNEKTCSMEESVNTEATKYVFIDQAIKFHQNNEFPIDDIVLELIFLMLAAFETTATTLFSSLMYLAMHPQHQEKVFEEIVTVFPKKEFDVNYADLKNFVYLDMCINETLRVASTVPMVARECTNDIPISKDITIPKGTQIMLDVFNIHRDEDIWGPSAKTFNPYHFLQANLDDHHKYSFIPFLKGPRNCIGWQYAGMMMKVALVQVLRKYRFSTKFRFEDLIFVEHVTLQYETLPLLEIHKR